MRPPPHEGEVNGSADGAGKKQRRSESVGIICKDPVHSQTPVAIVGGGIEGLAAALALARRGFQVYVFEKDASFLSRKQGYGLTLQQGGLALRWRQRRHCPG